ncbi:MAG: zinc-finger domain-containing protein [Alphaproteobacteria bacterium]|nr:zinc-finger domain-containing protein [Alphaproteobacteria bacterium]
MSDQDSHTVERPVVACDGGGGALGHPRVYLNMGTRREIACPYCSRRYVLKDEAAQAAH